MKTTVEKFYKAFDQLDAEAMSACYHEDVIFEDPAFGQLQGDRAKAMWCMLCASQKGKNFVVKASDIKANHLEGSAHWEAFYTFNKTGRKVHNSIEAHFTFKDGLIINHKDRFNLQNLAKQALGFKGWLLGGTSFFKTKLNKQTNTLLDRFINEKKLSENN